MGQNNIKKVKIAFLVVEPKRPVWDCNVSCGNMVFLIPGFRSVVNMWAPRLIGVVVAQTGAGHIRWEDTIGRPVSVQCTYCHNGTATSWMAVSRQQATRTTVKKTFAPLCFLLATWQQQKSSSARNVDNRRKRGIRTIWKIFLNLNYSCSQGNILAFKVCSGPFWSKGTWV